MNAWGRWLYGLLWLAAILLLFSMTACVPLSAAKKPVTWATLAGTAGRGDTVQVLAQDRSLLAETVTERDGAWRVSFPLPPTTRRGQSECATVLVSYLHEPAPLAAGAAVESPLETVRLCKPKR